MRDGRLFHADGRRQVGHRARRLPQARQDEQPIRRVTSACNVSATLAAEDESRVARGVARPSTPCPIWLFKHEDESRKSYM